MTTPFPPIEVFNKYKGTHCHKLWNEVGQMYICPSCKRNKYEIMRWTKRFPRKPKQHMDWIAVLHRHHDHASDSSDGSNHLNPRFPQAVICDQCNSADGVAKRRLNLPKDFSFSPQEIGAFISATPHDKHKVDFDAARNIYSTLCQQQKIKTHCFW